MPRTRSALAFLKEKQFFLVTPQGNELERSSRSSGGMKLSYESPVRGDR